MGFGKCSGMGSADFNPSFLPGVMADLSITPSVGDKLDSRSDYGCKCIYNGRVEVRTLDGNHRTLQDIG